MTSNDLISASVAATPRRGCPPHPVNQVWDDGRGEYFCRACGEVLDPKEAERLLAKDAAKFARRLARINASDRYGRTYR